MGVFEAQMYSIQVFDGGTPIPGNSYAPENALGDTFGGKSIHGYWVLAIDDLKAQTVQNQDNSMRRTQLNGKGALSDWVLHIIPDDAVDENDTLTYYVDLSATVLTLPKFGNLYVLNQNN